MVTRIIARQAAQTMTKAVLPAARRARKAVKGVRENVQDAVSGTLGLAGERMSQALQPAARQPGEAVYRMQANAGVLQR